MNENNNRKNSLISIGKLSRITGVHIQSLRYYERIGILMPAYIDDNRYRYYSFPQIKIVEAIQYCVDLDIPLKNFSMFISNDQKQINYDKLLQYGGELAQRKMESISRKMLFFEGIREDMVHGEVCIDHTPVVAHFPAKTYLITPYNGTQGSHVFQSIMMDLLEQVRSYGWQTSYDGGLLSVYTQEGAKHYASLEILNGSLLECRNVIHIPELDFVCWRKKESNIQSAPELFQEQFFGKYDKIVVERELFTGKFQYTEPCYELRCSLKKEDL